MPEGAIYVGRPSRFGNPFKVGQPLTDDPDDGRLTQALAVENFRWLASISPNAERWAAELRGRDLVCWCPLDQPCHADVLLELANP